MRYSFADWLGIKRGCDILSRRHYSECIMRALDFAKKNRLEMLFTTQCSA